MNRRQFVVGTAMLAGASAFRVPDTAAQGKSTFDLQPELPELVIGDPNAPVRLTEYASLTCPHCKTFHETVLPKLKTAYLDTGKASYALREFPFDPRAMAAFMLARCAPNGRTEAAIDLFFERQNEWSRAPNAVEGFYEVAKLMGMPRAEFEACLRNGELQGKIAAIQARGQNEFGVNAVPAMFVNGERLGGALTFETVSQAIDKASSANQ